MGKKLSFGNIRRVQLRDLPDNSSLFDKLDEIDYAVRYAISDPLESDSQTIFMDLIIWHKADVFLDGDTTHSLTEDWWHQICTAAKINNWLACGTIPTAQKWQMSLVGSEPASVSTLDEKVKLSPEWAALAESMKGNATKNRARLLDNNGDLSVVEKDPQSRAVRPYGSDEEFKPANGSIRPLPRPNLKQGTLRLTVVDEPMGKVGASGTRVIVTGSFAGCNVHVVFSNRITNFSDEVFLTQLLPLINTDWKELYERATLPKDIFDFISEKCDFKLHEDFKPVQLYHLQKLMQHIQTEVHGKGNTPTLSFDPVEDSKLNN